MPELTFEEMEQLLGSRAAARGFAEADDYWPKRNHAKEASSTNATLFVLKDGDTGQTIMANAPDPDGDRIHSVSRMSIKALHDIVLAVLEAFDGCALDGPEERERVARAITAVLASL